MLKKILVTMSIFFSVMALPASAGAFSFFSNTCTGQTATNSPICQQEAKQGTTNPVVHDLQVVSSVMALLAGMLAVIMMIVAGFQLVTSSGNEETVTKAKRRITSSLVGIVIVALTWTIIRFVTDHIIQ